MRCHSQSSQELKLPRNQYASQICKLHHHLVWMDYYKRLLRGISLKIWIDLHRIGDTRKEKIKLEDELLHEPYTSKP